MLWLAGALDPDAGGDIQLLNNKQGHWESTQPSCSGSTQHFPKLNLEAYKSPLPIVKPSKVYQVCNMNASLMGKPS